MAKLERFGVITPDEHKDAEQEFSDEEGYSSVQS